MSRRNLGIVAAACGFCLLGGYQLHVLAEGAPDSAALFYSGTLEQDGALASGNFTVTLALYAAVTGGVPLCEVETETAVEAGRFRIDVSDCAGAVHDQPDTWVALSFAGSDGVTRAIAGRTKIGAVPYALEADHAVSAGTATGDLDDRLLALEARVGALEAEPMSSGFLAIAKVDQTLSGTTYIVFDEEQFDFGDEYNDETGVFTTREGGFYEFSCIVGWNISDVSVVGQWEAALHVNGAERYYNGFTGSGIYATRMIHGVLQLEPNDEVQCATLQEVTAGLPLNVAYNFSVFEGRRFAR